MREHSSNSKGGDVVKRSTIEGCAVCLASGMGGESWRAVNSLRGGVVRCCELKLRVVGLF